MSDEDEMIALSFPVITQLAETCRTCFMANGLEYCGLHLCDEAEKLGGLIEAHRPPEREPALSMGGGDMMGE